jgi:hypothetical protein
MSVCAQFGLYKQPVNAGFDWNTLWCDIFHQTFRCWKRLRRFFAAAAAVAGDLEISSDCLAICWHEERDITSSSPQKPWAKATNARKSRQRTTDVDVCFDAGCWRLFENIVAMIFDIFERVIVLFSYGYNDDGYEGYAGDN